MFAFSLHYRIVDLPFQFEAHMPNQMTVLCLATCFRNNKALSILLDAKAEVNGRDARGDGALHWACVSDNAEGVRTGAAGC